MKIFTASFRLFFSISGILVLTFLTISVYSILNPSLVSDVGNVAGVTTESLYTAIPADVDLFESGISSLKFSLTEDSRKYKISTLDYKNDNPVKFLKFRNPNKDELQSYIVLGISDNDKSNMEIVLSYNDQELILNKVTGFSKRITLGSNSITELSIKINNLSNIDLNTVFTVGIE